MSTYLNEFARQLVGISHHINPLVEQAIENCCQSLLAEGRILTCGNGLAGIAADHLANALMHKLDHDRPGLPAINLSSSVALFSGITRDSHTGDTFARPVRALASRADILIAFSLDGRCANVLQAIQAMHDKEGRVIVVTAARDNDLSTLLSGDDLEVGLGDTPRKLAASCMTAIASALADGIEHFLFGQH